MVFLDVVSQKGVEIIGFWPNTWELLISHGL